MHFRNFRIAVVVNFFVFLLLGTALTGTVMLFLWQLQVVRTVTATSESFLLSLAGTPISVSAGPSLFQSVLADELRRRIGPERKVHLLFFAGESSEWEQLRRIDNTFIETLEEAAGRQAVIERSYGNYLSLFGVRPRYAVIAVPMIINKQYGAVGTKVSIVAITDDILENQSIVLVYLVVNTILLTAIWFFRMRQLIFVPLDKLVLKAEAFGMGQGDFLGLGHKKNAFGKLADTLSSMIERIEADRKKLSETISSLEKANAQILANQNSLVKAEKFAAVGRLAAGLAHEVGNPLGIIQGYMELLGREDLTAEERDQYVQRAGKELERVIRLLRQLLDYAGHKKETEASSQVAPVIWELVEMLKNQKNTVNIDFAVKCPDESLRVRCSEAELHQILLNCLLNAIDAIQEKPSAAGCIEIDCLQESGGAAGTVVLRITDDGSGIEEKNLKNIFEPFFTTKEIGKGTGLGLSVTRTIVENCGGGIEVANSTAGGTVVSVSLPER